VLIFESAFNLDPRLLRQNLGPVLILAVRFAARRFDRRHCRLRDAVLAFGGFTAWRDFERDRPGSVISYSGGSAYRGA